MTMSKFLLTATAVGALALPVAANAQLTVGATTDVKANVGTQPVQSTLGSVQETVNQATDKVDSVTPDTQANVDADVNAQVGDTNVAADVVAATPADLKVGQTVRDTTGAVVGKVESVNANGAVVATGNSRVAIPASSFGKNDQGLVLAMTKAQLDAAAAAAANPG